MRSQQKAVLHVGGNFMEEPESGGCLRERDHGLWPSRLAKSDGYSLNLLPRDDIPQDSPRRQNGPCFAEAKATMGRRSSEKAWYYCCPSPHSLGSQVYRTESFRALRYDMAPQYSCPSNSAGCCPVEQSLSSRNLPSSSRRSFCRLRRVPRLSRRGGTGCALRQRLASGQNLSPRHLMTSRTENSFPDRRYGLSLNYEQLASLAGAYEAVWSQGPSNAECRLQSVRKVEVERRVVMIKWSSDQWADGRCTWQMAHGKWHMKCTWQMADWQNGRWQMQIGKCRLANADGRCRWQMQGTWRWHVFARPRPRCEELTPP